jgi:hypothetical protein
VADCPRPDCLGAEHFGHAPITGHVGGLTQVGFRCNRCGLVCASDWPENAQDIWWVLSQRPLMEKRNWFPHETLEDLIVENITHGVVPAELEAGRALRILNGHLVGVELTGSSRFAIGGGTR